MLDPSAALQTAPELEQQAKISLMPQPHDWGFGFMVFGVPPPSPDVRVAFIPVPDQQVQELARMLSKKFLEPLPEVPADVAAKLGPRDVLVAPALVPEIGIPGYPPLHAVINRYGQTAATATWIHRMTIEVSTGRRGGQVQAVSLYLTGVDRAADNAAISACRSMRFGARQSLPVTPDVYEKILEEPRPLAVQIFCQPLARLDPSIQCAFLALGVAFFGTLGVEGEGPGQ